MKNLFKYILVTIGLFMGVILLTGGFGIFFIVPIISIMASLYIADQVAKKIFPEDAHMSKFIFKIVLGILLACVCMAIFWHPAAI